MTLQKKYYTNILFLNVQILKCIYLQNDAFEIKK